MIKTDVLNKETVVKDPIIIFHELISFQQSVFHIILDVSDLIETATNSPDSDIITTSSRIARR